MNLDNPSDFNAALNKAVNLGILHVSVLAKRVKPKALINMIEKHFCQTIKYRNFHLEIMNRAYGMAFINQTKMEWVKERNLKEKK